MFRGIREPPGLRNHFSVAQKHEAVQGIQFLCRTFDEPTDRLSRNAHFFGRCSCKTTLFLGFHITVK